MTEGSPIKETHLREKGQSHNMATWIINLKEQTVTSINGMTFRLNTTNGEFESMCFML